MRKVGIFITAGLALALSGCSAEVNRVMSEYGSTPKIDYTVPETGETYWKVKNGLRLTGMPAYQKLLSDTEMWQVSLLLKNADQNLSPAVQAILTNPEPALATPGR